MAGFNHVHVFSDPLLLTRTCPAIKIKQIVVHRPALRLLNLATISALLLQFCQFWQFWQSWQSVDREAPSGAAQKQKNDGPRRRGQSLVSQRHKWIYARGANCRHGACNQGQQTEKQRNNQECCCIGGLDAEQQTGKRTNSDECEDNSHANADQNQPRALSQDQSQNAAALGSQGHADADFLASLQNGIGKHAVDADAGEKNCDS